MKRKATLNDNDGAVELGTMTRNLKLSGEEPARLQEKVRYKCSQVCVSTHAVLKNGNDAPYRQNRTAKTRCATSMQSWVSLPLLPITGLSF